MGNAALSLGWEGAMGALAEGLGCRRGLVQQQRWSLVCCTQQWGCSSRGHGRLQRWHRARQAWAQLGSRVEAVPRPSDVAQVRVVWRKVCLELWRVGLM